MFFLLIDQNKGTVSTINSCELQFSISKAKGPLVFAHSGVQVVILVQKYYW